jgi:hypothetical protein
MDLMLEREKRKLLLGLLLGKQLEDLENYMLDQKE